MKLQQDLSEFVGLLLSGKVEFVLVGGYALAKHGVPRFTEDIDFLIMLSPGNAARIVEVLGRFGFGELGIGEEDLLKPGQVIQLGRAPNRIDLLTSLSGVTWEEVWGSRETMEMGGHTVPVISREMLIKNKLATGRTQDLVDVERLQAEAET